MVGEIETRRCASEEPPRGRLAQCSPLSTFRLNVSPFVLHNKWASMKALVAKMSGWLVALVKTIVESSGNVGGPRGTGPGGLSFVSCRLRARLFGEGSITRELASSRHEAGSYSVNPSLRQERTPAPSIHAGLQTLEKKLS